MDEVPISEAVLCFNPINTKDGGEDWCSVKTLPVRMPHQGQAGHYLMTVGAVFAGWREADTQAQKLQLMIELWHAAAFHGVPVEELHRAALVIPEYRDMLADDCLPNEFRHERD